MFVVGFYVLCVACAVLYYYTRTAVESPDDGNFKRFQSSYLVVYLMAVGGFLLVVYRSPTSLGLCSLDPPGSAHQCYRGYLDLYSCPRPLVRDVAVENDPKTLSLAQLIRTFALNPSTLFAHHAIKMLGTFTALACGL
ncbi:unnamed protein product [Heligmosomoides polygyrus]|uniref:Very-long-chain 3-oxoacyl-CoA synthase n=1 Tax=Heligmosomoides polygyrus TaxID=6339 RepID=A0A183G5Q2_HELPZ|nr:unnamed protein product [Heligmosomoides polygyrus]